MISPEKLDEFEARHRRTLAAGWEAADKGMLAIVAADAAELVADVKCLRKALEQIGDLCVGTAKDPMPRRTAIVMARIADKALGKARA